MCAHWVAKDLRFLHADSEDSGQTGWITLIGRRFTVTLQKDSLGIYRLDNLAP